MSYAEVKTRLAASPEVWLVTGAAGFIGSNLVENLLNLNQRVVGFDNFSTGKTCNLDEVRSAVGPTKWRNFKFVRGDIQNVQQCYEVCKGVDHVLHQAALGSVPRSVSDPIATNSSNIGGFLNLLVAARDSEVRSFTYAASSSTYGDHPSLPKLEENIGKPLSPYAVTKYVNELYAEVFAQAYGFKSIGLRYFNVFGKRQDPNGAYAAVIPRWASSMLLGNQIYINGDGSTSRDFCFIENVVQANLLAATADDTNKNEVYNVALGDRTSLNELYLAIKATLVSHGKSITASPIYRDFRAGDVKHSQADINKAMTRLGYSPKFRLLDGLTKAMPWYIENVGGR